MPHLRRLIEGASGSPGRPHPARSAATAITPDERRWTGASRTASTISSVSTNTVLAAQVFIKTDDVVRRATANLNLVRDYHRDPLSRQILVASPPRLRGWIEGDDESLVPAIVTNITYGAPAWLYDSVYCARGQAKPDQAAQEPAAHRSDQLSFAAGQPDEADPAHRRLLADADCAR